jgi:hypothetical protein
VAEDWVKNPVTIVKRLRETSGAYAAMTRTGSVTALTDYQQGILCALETAEAALLEAGYRENVA